MAQFWLRGIILIAFSLEIAKSYNTEMPDIKAAIPEPEIEVEPTPEAQPLFFNPSGSLLEAAARGVAQLVSSNFAAPQPPPRQVGPDFMSNVLKILGLDSSKLGAIALNAVIFLAQLIGGTLSGQSASLKTDEDDDVPPPGNPLTWIFYNSPNQARELVRAAREKNLPEKLIELLRDGASTETDCVQLLLCKSAPVIWSMQRSLYKPPDPFWASMTPLQRMFTYLPTIEEISEHSSSCDIRYPSCKLRHSKL